MYLTPMVPSRVVTSNLCPHCSIPGKYPRRIERRILQAPLTRYAKLRFAHAKGTFSPPTRISDPYVHHGMPRSLTSAFISSWWRAKRSWHSRCMRNQQFCVSVKMPITIVPWLNSFSLDPLEDRRKITDDKFKCNYISENWL